MARWPGLRRIFGRRLPIALAVCEVCGGHELWPTAWAPDDDPWWRVELRCPACGHRRTEVVGPTHRQLIARYDQQRMQRWTDTFIEALRRDLVEPCDFTSVRPRAAERQE